MSLNVFLVISNIAVLLTLWQFVWLISKYSEEHRNLASDIVEVRKDLSLTIRFFETPMHMDYARSSRRQWIDEIVKALSREKCSVGINGIEVGNTERSGLLSQLISILILCGGFTFLMRIAYTEILAYRSMKTEEKKAEKHGKNIHAVSITEFIQYR